jgi:mannose-1-phosphate guanylyltransferase
MAGGSGTRLWPLSRSKQPKQFLRLNGENTMLQETAVRLRDLNLQSSIVICNEDHRFFVAEQLKEINMLDSVILEPEGKDTAPAIALAAFASLEEDPILLVLAADHVIQDHAGFKKAVLTAIPLAESGKLVTFGIVPTEPNTGYGYIKRGNKHSGGYTVEKFVEKPVLKLAQEYLDSGEFYWNSGMFLFRASRYLEELEKYRPDIHQACKDAMKETVSDVDFIRVNAAAFGRCPAESVDYAVMENTLDSVVVPMDAGWSDIGSWASLWDISKKGVDGNVTHGDVITHKTRDCYVRSESKLVAAIGVNDLVIVSTKDAVMVAHKNSVQDVKVIADKLKANSRSEWQFHRDVYRPWGKYDAVDNGNNYQVKRITVNPGAKLSVQMHHHRSEHWIVVAGTAKVTNGDKTFLLSENESTYIPIGVVHALENPGKISLELIEVQSGSYLGEDDIVRFEDNYGRETQKK